MSSTEPRGPGSALALALFLLGGAAACGEGSSLEIISSARAVGPRGAARTTPAPDPEACPEQASEAIVEDLRRYIVPPPPRARARQLAGEILAAYDALGHCRDWHTDSPAKRLEVLWEHRKTETKRRARARQ